MNIILMVEVFTPLLAELATRPTTRDFMKINIPDDFAHWAAA